MSALSTRNPDPRFSREGATGWCEAIGEPMLHHRRARWVGPMTRSGGTLYCGECRRRYLAANSARMFPCQLGHDREVMVTDATYEAHLRRAHPSEARDLGLLSR